MSLSSFLFHCAMCWWGRSEWEDAGVQGGKHLRKLTRYRVLSKKRSAGFSAMADLVSACSLAFLDGPTGLHLTFTVTLHRKREVKTGGGAVITDIPMQWVTWEKGTVQVYSGDSVCFSYSRILKGKKKNLWVGDGGCGALTGFAEIEAGLKERVGAGILEAGRVLCLVFLALVSPYVCALTCLLPWIPVIPTELMEIRILVNKHLVWIGACNLILLWYFCFFRSSLYW